MIIIIKGKEDTGHVTLRHTNQRSTSIYCLPIKSVFLTIQLDEFLDGNAYFTNNLVWIFGKSSLRRYDNLKQRN